MVENKDSSINMLTVADIAKIMHIGKNAAYELVKNPTFPSIQLGSRYLTSEKELEIWIHNHTSKN